MKPLTKVLAYGTGCVVLLLLVAFILVLTFAEGSTTCTLPSGRSIKVVANNLYLAVSTSKDTATIDTVGHQVVIAPKAVQVDGVNIATIDPATRSVEVAVRWGEVTVVGDGETVAKWQR